MMTAIPELFILSFSHVRINFEHRLMYFKECQLLASSTVWWMSHPSTLPSCPGGGNNKWLVVQSPAQHISFKDRDQ